MCYVSVLLEEMRINLRKLLTLILALSVIIRRQGTCRAGVPSSASPLTTGFVPSHSLRHNQDRTPTLCSGPQSGVAQCATPEISRRGQGREFAHRQFFLIVNLLKLAPSSTPVPVPLSVSETSPLVIA
jgi:hypothetical protein